MNTARRLRAVERDLPPLRQRDEPPRGEARLPRRSFGRRLRRRSSAGRARWNSTPAPAASTCSNARRPDEIRKRRYHSSHAPMRFAIIGAGGIGGYFGALHRARRPRRDVSWPAASTSRRSGRAASRSGSRTATWTVPAVATEDPAELLPADFAIVAVKSYSLAEVAPASSAARGGGAVVVPLLNGVEAFETLAAAGVPRRGMLAGLAVISAESPVRASSRGAATSGASSSASAGAGLRSARSGSPRRSARRGGGPRLRGHRPRPLAQVPLPVDDRRRVRPVRARRSARCGRRRSGRSSSIGPAARSPRSPGRAGSPCRPGEEDKVLQRIGARSRTEAELPPGPRAGRAQRARRPLPAPSRATAGRRRGDAGPRHRGRGLLRRGPACHGGLRNRRIKVYCEIAE